MENPSLQIRFHSHSGMQVRIDCCEFFSFIQIGTRQKHDRKKPVIGFLTLLKFIPNLFLGKRR